MALIIQTARLMEKLPRRIICLSLLPLSFMAICGSLLVTSKVSADDSAVTVTTISVPVACTMRGVGTTHTATLGPGAYSGNSGSGYEDGIGKTTLTAICNDDNGFSIYAIGFTGNQYGTTTLVGETTGSAIATKVYASGDSISNWSMKLNKITDATESYNPQNLSISSGYNTWHSVPESYTKVAEYHANTGSSATDVALGVKLETTYAAFVAVNQPADTYVGQVKYTMVHPYNEDAPEIPFSCPNGYICYLPNAEDAIGTMNVLSEYTRDTTSTNGYQAVTGNQTTLTSPNYSRAGYGFASWNTEPDGTGTNYGPNQTIATSGSSGAGITLYANWVAAETNVTMQTFDETASPYASAPNGTVIALTDSRDNETYAVAKLADGVWWMIENLRLDPSSATITSANTNNPSASFLASYGNTTSTDYWCADGLDYTCTDTIVYNTRNINRSLPAYPGYQMDPETGYTYIVNAWHSYGVYYNWYTATAGYGDKDFGTTDEQPLDDSLYVPSTPGDICPAGWRIPPTALDSNWQPADDYSSSDLGSALYLINSLGTSVAFYSYPNNIVTSGTYNLLGDDPPSDEDPRDIDRWSDAYAESWTSTINYYGGDDPMVILHNSPEVNISQKNYGHTVRCRVQ